jgi:hypothetical protein
MTTREAVGFFVSYFGCTEEGRYCVDPERVLTALTAARLPRARDAILEYERVYGASWEREILRPTLLENRSLEEFRQGRAAQLVLYVAAMEWCKTRMDVRAYAAYSFGYGAALISAGVLTANDVLAKFLPWNRDYAADNFAAWQTDRLRTTFLSATGAIGFAAFVKELSASSGGEVIVKDDRAPFAVQLVGPEDALVALRKRIFDVFPNAERESTGVARADGAHLHPERYGHIRERFKAFDFHAPESDVVLPDGGVWRAGAEIVGGADTLFNVIHAVLTTSHLGVMNRLHSGRTIALSSQKVMRFSLFGLGVGVRPERWVLWEDVLLAH